MSKPKVLSMSEVNKLLDDPIKGRSEITQLELDLLCHIDRLKKENKRLKQKLKQRTTADMRLANARPN